LLGADVAGDDVEQRRLAGAVATDQPDASAGHDAGRGIFKKRAAGDADGEVVDDKHGAALWPSRRADATL
jgi:hypothetical protein